MPKGILLFPMLIFGLIFVSGLLNAISPRLMWKTFESWKATKEPSNTYFMARRISGILAMLIVSGLLLFPYFMSRQ
ncbi:DUF6199 family natural product biosynthesis protein [Paenibacillus monticola]|uniref:DUF6199 domain-containing protein n=1 Tax=Paenibacillus monticola TaxID=2666075 RepID=A0A7X2L303_9BACL|nr:DUF6199 family natural product biosynthesis protein [Paenibacillus monticola]MRN54775.1 hypothetical protein [Paenibacillus monticola]